MERPLPPCVLFEDDHLLVAEKPCGLNTHRPAPFTGEGLYDWLRGREPRWAQLSIIHRLDKETSGILLFGKTREANVSLSRQFESRQVEKTYLLVTDREPCSGRFTVESNLARDGDHYTRVQNGTGDRALTAFEVLGKHPLGWLVQARPETGRTHQIRVHAADSEIPILGDTLYGGTRWQRVCLHAAALRLSHPVGGEELCFHSEVDFAEPAWWTLRKAILDPSITNAYRLLHGGADGFPEWFVDRLGPWVLAQSGQPFEPEVKAWIEPILRRLGAEGLYVKRLDRQLRDASTRNTSPTAEIGKAPPRFEILENGLKFGLGFEEGYSVGLFLDQRDNRRRLLINHVAPDFPVWANLSDPPSILNTFAYTCGFSVAAAVAGARTTSLDLSRKYLDRGRENFALNGVDPAGHDFIFGDVFDWMRRWRKKGRRFDVVLLDPPTFSQSKESGIFRAGDDYHRLAADALPLLESGGVLFASTNASTLAPEAFLAQISDSIRAAGRTIRHQHYVPQPIDFPISPKSPAYLKTVWMRID